MLDKLITYLLGLIWACGCKVLSRGCAVGSRSFLPITVLNLFTCPSLTLINLDSLTFFMKSVYFYIVVFVTIDDSLELHLSSLIKLPWSKLHFPQT